MACACIWSIRNIKCYNNIIIVVDDDYGMRLCLWTVVTSGPIVQPPGDYMSVESHGGMILTGENWRTWRKTCPNATLSTTHLSWTDLGVNPGFHGGRPATNHLSYGMVYGSVSKPLIKIVSHSRNVIQDCAL
jgi:hypothetical protein